MEENDTAYKKDKEKLEREIKALEQQISETHHQNGQVEQLQKCHRALTTKIRDMSNEANLKFDGNLVDTQGTLFGGSVSNGVPILDVAGQHYIIKKQIIAKQHSSLVSYHQPLDYNSRVDFMQAAAKVQPALPRKL